MTETMLDAGRAMDALSDEALAQRFHDFYERLAPSFSYETRRESAKPWAEVPENNRRLMIAVCANLRSSGAFGTLAALTSEVVAMRENAARMDELTERVAEAIYDAMREHDPVGRGRPWVPRGNSDKQDEARRRARAAFASQPTTNPETEARDNGTR